MKNKIDNKKLILIELNELNFDIVSDYLRKYPKKFPNFEKLDRTNKITTKSETKYENLEPWIQWVSVHTGKNFAEHKIFRLGDIVGSNIPQIFELLEKNNYRVGSISAMNAENRLKKSDYFIPDPWTNTSTDGSWWSNKLTDAIKQTVNDNSQSRITATSAFYLFLAFLRFSKYKNYLLFFKLLITAKKRPWYRALIFDLFLHNIHMDLYTRSKPNFSVLFLNAGAHIQHHYFLNAEPIRDSSELRNPDWYISPNFDPIADMLFVYDAILEDYLAISDVEILLATGLSQRPYDRIKYYHRLKDHESFLNLLGIRYQSVSPRMTRDFLVTFDSISEAEEAYQFFKNIYVSDDLPLFGEIDNRGTSLFVTLTYPNEINKHTSVLVNGSKIMLIDHLVFVAIKNGMHQDTGFAFFSSGLKQFAPVDGSHVKELYNTLLKYFETNDSEASNSTD